MKPFYKRKRFYALLGIASCLTIFWLNRPSSQEEQAETHSTNTQIKGNKNTEMTLAEQSLATLEKADTPVSRDQKTAVQDTLNIALTYTRELGTSIAKENDTVTNQLLNAKALEVLGTIEGHFDNRLSLTNLNMIQTLVTMFSVGYAYDEASLQVFESDSDNVYQFLFTLSRDEAELNFVGNFVTGTQQLEITSMQGQPVPLTQPEKGDSK